MWFGVSEKSDPTDMTTVEMKRIYEKGIRPAVEAAGYRVTRVDLEEFNDCIMDKVLGDIRAAPFVVADFTGHRNGVYLEAGFARGLGHPVIQTCAESHMDKAHFDTRHLNHICWKDASDLRERLLQRIRGTIGVGPYWDGARSS
jgi:nucleoside 2-deoxyribosyltransferase